MAGAENSARESAAAAPVANAQALIERRYDRRLDLRVLARAANLSKFHFIRAFRKSFSETPHQYLIRRRIERAKELLADTVLPVTEICFEVGFESVGSFSTLFHRVVGWAPSVYRARVLEQRACPRKFIPACCWNMLGFGESAAISEKRVLAPVGYTLRLDLDRRNPR